MTALIDDHEKILDEALNNVRIQSFHIRKMIENSNLRQCLKETSIMLNELKTSYLSPRNYYQLYTTVFDQMQYVEQAFKEEHRRGRKISALYESVQQALGIIPRIYLTITAGSVYIQSLEINAKDILNELLGMIKGVQNPLRGLFGRYYLLKMIKDKLPDVGNEYIGEGGSVEDTIKFILQNLEEMNRLWIRLSMGCTGNEKLLKEKERNELKVLVGENIIRLSSLQGLTIEMYKNDVLPKIITILLDSKDMLSQYYLMECIIFAFPNDYNTHCMNLIIETCPKLLPSVDLKSLLINLMDKLSKIIENKETDSFSNQNIFNLLRDNIDQIISDQSNLDKHKLLELLAAFMKFTLKCNPNKIEYVNHILSSACNVLSKEIGTISNLGIKIIVTLLSSPLDSLVLEIFEINQYPILMNYLDFSNRKTLAMRIVDSLNKSKEKLSSPRKITILQDFIKSLLEDTTDLLENDALQFEYEMQNVAKLIYLVNDSDVNNMLSMYSQLKSILFKGGVKRMKYTIPPLISVYLLLISKLSYGISIKEGNSDNEIRDPNLNNFIEMEIKFDNDEEYIEILKKLYSDISDCIKVLKSPYPEMAFRLNLLVVHSVNNLKVGKDKFSETARLFIENNIKLYNEEITDQELKLNCLYQLIGTLCEIAVLDKENYLFFVENLIGSTTKISKRSDQCVATLACSNLFWNKNLEDYLKTIETLKKAKKFAEYSMTIPQNLNLFVILLNKYLYFIEKGVNFVDASMLNDMIDIIKNHIQTIKSENTNASFLPDIEKYYEKTIEYMSKRCNDRPIFKEIIHT